MNRTFSRRTFSKLIGLGAASAALEPSLIANTLHAKTAFPANVVRLSSNENPYGPSPAALKAMTEGFSLAWRYPDENADMLVDELAKLHGVSSDQVLLGDGSGEILKLCAAAFTGKDRKLLMANPTFEAIGRHANVAGAEVVRISLTSDYRHDLEKMLAATNSAPAKNVGLIYICNPNNPTASITPKSELTDFLTKVSPTTMVLVDEAYHHYVETPDYESVISLTREHPNLIVARTFSKIYGMAGLRCGYCVAQRENMRRMSAHQIFDSVNIMAVVAALASLRDTDHVARGRKLNSEVKKSVCAELKSMGYGYIPSHANFMMIDLASKCNDAYPCGEGRTVPATIGALRTRGVEVGRVFPALSNFMRVTIGTSGEMQAFLTAFKEAMA